MPPIFLIAMLALAIALYLRARNDARRIRRLRTHWADDREQRR